MGNILCCSIKRNGAISLGLILVCFDYYKIVIMLKDGLIDLYSGLAFLIKGWPSTTTRSINLLEVNTSSVELKNNPELCELD